jgi:hypothetical protein
VFLDTYYTKDVLKFLGCKATRLDRPIVTKGYNRVRGNPITHYLLVDLVINSRRLIEVLFLILNLGNYNMILRAKWIVYFDV